MNVAIDIPDSVARRLQERSGELSRAVLEAVAVEAYRSGAITSAEVQQMLGLGSRWETEEFLRQAAAYLDYTMEDFDSDLAAIREASAE